MTQASLFAHFETPRNTAPSKPDHPYGWLAQAGQRTARPWRCRTCRAPILSGLDANLAAFRAEADPTPLTALGEALTTLDSIRTLDLTVSGTTGRLTRRGRWRIPSMPAGGRAPGVGDRYDVLPEHHCGRVTPAAWSAPARALPPPAADTLTSDRPPF